MTRIEREKADAYKVGFLLKLAQMGILPSEFAKRASLSALALVNAASGALGSGTSLASEVGSVGLKGALLAPLIVGSATGAAEGLTDAPSNEDIEFLRKKETLELYKRLSKEISLRRAMREQHII
jgi:hypothetical protein